MKSTAEIVTAKLRELSKDTFTNSLADLKQEERESVKTALKELNRMLLDLKEHGSGASQTST